MPPAPAWPVYSEVALIVDHLFGHASVGNDHGLLPGEETLTDVAMLSHARRRFPFTTFRGRLPRASELRVHKFNNPQESKTGADWNLLLIDGSGQRISFRIQAKKLYVDGSYSKMSAAQTAKLISLSNRQGAIPLFGLYQGTQYLPTRSACRIPGANDRMGCVVRDASALQAAHPTTPNQWQAQAALALPLQCLVSCLCSTGGRSTPASPRPSASPFDPAQHSNMPAFGGISETGRALARGSDTEEVPPPEDRIGPYLERFSDLPRRDERPKDVIRLDDRGQFLFEGISYCVIYDGRLVADRLTEARPVAR